MGRGGKGTPHRRWTDPENDLLRARWSADRTLAENLDRLAPLLPGRTRDAIERQASTLRAGGPQGRDWTTEENVLLTGAWGERGQAWFVARLGRSWLAIYEQAQALGLPAADRGRERVSTAAARCGVARGTLRRMLAGAGVVPMAHVGRLDDARRTITHRVVEPELAELLVGWWAEGETAEVARARHHAGDQLTAHVARTYGLGGRGHGLRTRLPPDLWDALVRDYRGEAPAPGDGRLLEVARFAARPGTGDAFTRSFAARAALRGEWAQLALLPQSLSDELGLRGPAMARLATARADARRAA